MNKQEPPGKTKDVLANVERVELADHGKIILDLETYLGDFYNFEVKGGIELSVNLKEHRPIYATLIETKDDNYEIYSLRIPNKKKGFYIRKDK